MYPILYYILSAGLLAVLIYLCRPIQISRDSTPSFQSNALFLGLALLLLVVMRLPSLSYNRELNADESQLLTQAITLQQDPVYGRSVDGTSIGPVNTYLLLIPTALGLPLDYTTARYVALLLIATALVLFYFSLLRLTTPVISRLSFLPILLFFGWTTEPNFLHYSSELTSLVILTACFGLAVGVLQQSNPPSVGVLAGLGVLTGLAVYCKLQTLPIIAMILVTLTVYLWRTHRKTVLLSLVVLAVGFFVPTIIVFGQAYWFRTEGYFVDYYFAGNLTTYSQIYKHVPLVHQGLGSKLIRFPAFLRKYADFLLFVVFNFGLTVATALLIGRLQRRFNTSSIWLNSLVGLTILGALWAVVTPGTEFGHHLLLLVFPFGWGIALGLHHLMQSILNQRLWLRLATALLGVYILEVVVTDNLLLAYGKQLKKRVTPTRLTTQPDTVQNWLVNANPYLFSFPARAVLPLSPVAQAIRHFTFPSDKIAVWGWNCRYYVETGLPQGVRENHTQRSAVPNRMQDAYLSRYAQDLAHNKPAVFVDAVGDSSLVLIQPKYRHEQFNRINHIIQQNYRLVDSVKQVRIYVRRDRLSQFSQKG